MRLPGEVLIIGSYISSQILSGGLEDVFFSFFLSLLLCIFAKPRRPQRGGDKSFDINHCVMFRGKAKSSGDWLLIALVD